MSWLRLLVLVALTAGAPPAWAQTTPRPEVAAPSLDERVLVGIYQMEAPAFRYAVQAAHATARPVFYGAPVAAWGGAWLFREDSDYADAYRLTVSEVAAYGLAMGLKRWADRPRPYATVPGITSRSDRYHEGAPGTYRSFPSGHATLAFALATSWSLSHPVWYVVAPGFVWASGVALSRVWLGVHYSSDVLAGAALGAGVALTVHLLAPYITPEALEGETEAPPSVSLFYLRVPL